MILLVYYALAHCVSKYFEKGKGIPINFEEKFRNVENLKSQLFENIIEMFIIKSLKNISMINLRIKIFYIFEKFIK